MSWHYFFPFFALFRFDIAAAFFLASALEDAPHALSDNNNRVGLPFFFSGPFMLPIRAKKLARLGLSPDFTGRFKLEPVVLLKNFLPASLRPPLGF
jgi:hypothetical protein